MSKGEILLQFGIYVVPSIAFFASVWYFTSKWYEIQSDKNKLAAIHHKPEQKQAEFSELKKQFFPLQVDAYQRLVLFLERIAPNNMVMRMNNPGLPARIFQQNLLETIRNEFEHNLAQQVYISPEAWTLLKNSKEEVVKIINMAATKLEPTSTATDLSKGIFEITSQLEQQPTDRAINYLKVEMRNLIV